MKGEAPSGRWFNTRRETSMHKHWKEHTQKGVSKGTGTPHSRRKSTQRTETHRIEGKTRKRPKKNTDCLPPTALLASGRSYTAGPQAQEAKHDCLFLFLALSPLSDAMS